MVPHKYISREPDAAGVIQYSDEENCIWAELYQRQSALIRGRACEEFLQGLRQLQLPIDRVPQLSDASRPMLQATGWQVAPVPALISFKRFFDLLANRSFPSATFIRIREEMDYLQEPDIFHEIYGHCPLLMHPLFADFAHIYGQVSARANAKDQVMLARLYWFTIEFGLMQTVAGLRVYGAGLLSSFGETCYALESPVAERRPFDLMDILRTPYRIDIFQPIYYVIESFDQLYALASHDLEKAIVIARELGPFAPTYSPKAGSNK